MFDEDEIFATVLQGVPGPQGPAGPTGLYPIAIAVTRDWTVVGDNNTRPNIIADILDGSGLTLPPNNGEQPGIPMYFLLHDGAGAWYSVRAYSDYGLPVCRIDNESQSMMPNIGDTVYIYSVYARSDPVFFQ